MTDADFLPAILAAPDDDAPRLIYADWLEERGDAARAEFIRLQCALARLPLSDPRVRPMREREEELLTEHHRAWLGELHDWAVHWKCRRGLVEEVALEAQVFLDHGEEIFRLAPIRHVLFYNARPILSALVSSTLLGFAPSLNFRYNELGNDGARGLVRSPYLNRVTALDLAGNGIEDGGVRAIAGSGSLDGLLSLDLSENLMTDEGAAALLHTPNLPRLRRLDIRWNSTTTHADNELRRRFSDLVT